jgi:hypothetical protein
MPAQGGRCGSCYDLQMDWPKYAAIAVLTALAPFVWWVIMGTALWLGRKLLPDRAGRILFGHYWYGSSRFRLKKR